MLKILTQRKIILILLLFSVFFVLAFSVELLKKQGFLDALKENLVQKLKKDSQVFAQEYAPYFFPRFPQRLIYLLSSVNVLTEELVELNEELTEQFNKSDCSLAFSECLPKIAFGGTGCQPGRVLGSPYQNIKEIEEKKEEIGNHIDNLFFLKELLKKEMESGLPQELATLRQEVAEELKNNLEKTLEKSEGIIKVAKENQDLYNKDYTKNCVAQCQPGPVCGIKACAMLGTGPQKHININAKIEVGLDDLELGKVGIDKFGLALPDKLQFPQLGDITVSIPPQTLQVCFPFQPITVSADPPSFATLPTLSFACPKLPWDLKLPELPIPKLPKEIKIPSFEIPEIKFCPDIPEIPLMEELEKIRQELTATAQQEIGEFKNKIDEAISQIDELIKKAPGPLKEELEKLKKDLLKEYEEVKGEIPKKAEAPTAEFETTGVSQEYQYQSPESKGLELEDISLSYQCGQTSGDEEVNTKAETNWYFETLSWLMEKCANLPTMSTQLGLQEKAANCYNPDKVAETIVNECDALWNDYCSVDESGIPIGPEPPSICKKIRYSCDVNSGIAAAIQCQNLFNQEGLTTPSECRYIPADYYETEYYCPDPDYPDLSGNFCLHKNFNPVSALKNKCQELKNKYPKEPPESCKILPLFTGKIEAPGTETYYGTPTSCPAQNLLNVPFGFGGGLGFNCPLGLPSLPKIVLPDIVIPDIILPEFNVPPFLKVKLPSIIIEDLILPDVELCDLNDCSNVFPSLYFKLPYLKLPSFDISAPLPQLPGLDLRTRIDFPEINFSLPQINLFNLLLPELKLPEIKIPSPKINFGITGIDVSAIFDLIFTFILNALDVSDFGYCLIFKIPTTFLSIVFPDYYFSFLKFPELPKIPFCEDVNQFCKKAKNALGEGGWLKKAKEIEAEFNRTIDKIQKELDKVNAAAEKAQAAIDEVFKEVYGKLIYDAIAEQLAKKGLSLQDYINPKTKEIDLSKVPFPGVFPVKTVDNRECLPVSTPQINIILRIGNYPEKCQKDCELEYAGEDLKKCKTTCGKMKIEKKLSPPPIQFVIYVPVDIPLEIPIPWPEELKKIKLACNTSECDKCMSKGKSFCQKGCREEFGECNADYSECAAECYELYKDVCKKECQGCLFYELPTISLCELNYKKEFPIKTFGFQPRTFYFDFGKVNEGDCLAEPPKGGNPFPMSQIISKLNAIKNIKEELDNSFQTVIEILE